MRNSLVVTPRSRVGRNRIAGSDSVSVEVCATSHARESADAANLSICSAVPNAPCMLLRQLSDQLDALKGQMQELRRSLQTHATDEPTSYDIATASIRLRRAKFTLREWCRNGRITAYRSNSGRGPYSEWRIPAEAIRYYEAHGLLDPPDRQPRSVHH